MAKTTSARQKVGQGSRIGMFPVMLRVTGSILLVLCLLGIGWAQAPESAAPQKAQPTSVAPASLPIGVGDLLQVDVFDTPELSGRLRVDEHGEVQLPVGGTVKVSGLTAEGAARAIEAQLKSTDMMLHPSVAILIVEFANQGVTVLGEVRNPGVYPYLGSKSLFDLISQAGGLAPTASKQVTIVHRGDPNDSQTVDLNDAKGKFTVSNVAIFPGDTIMVVKSGIVYVLGAVGRPGGYLVDNNQRISVLEALALAQGMGPTAKMSKARLIRRTNSGKEDMPLPVNEIIANKIPDSPLQDGDIIFVPSSTWKQVTIGMLPGLASAAIYKTP